MVKIIRVVILLFFTTLLFAQSPKALIKEAEQLLKSNKKSNILKAYNNYKSAYLKALINENEKYLQIALDGIQKSEKKLGIKKIIRKKRKAPLHIQKPQKKLPVILNYKSNINQIIITFSKPISKNQITSFKLSDNGLIKEVFDIFAVFKSGLVHIKSNFFKDVRMAKYDEQTTRIVLEKQKSFYVKTDILGNKLILSAYVLKKNMPKPKFIPVVKLRKKETVIQNIAKNKVIFIDAGHGGKDSGAIGYFNLQEKNIVLKIAKLATKELKKRGYHVIMSRKKDVFIKLRDRTRMANKNRADLFISIHANSFPAKRNVKGIETFFLSPARSDRAKRVAAKENKSDLDAMNNLSQQTFLSFLNREKVVASNKLAIDLQKNILSQLSTKYTGINDSGVREGPFWVLVGAQMPAVLIEVGYLTNKKEAKRLKTTAYQQLLAKGIANGVDAYFYHNFILSKWIKELRAKGLE